MPTITTYSGIRMNPVNPQREEIDILHQKERKDIHLRRIGAKEMIEETDTHWGVMIVDNKGATNQEIEEGKD